LILLEFRARICFEIVRIRDKCVINWSRIKRVCSLCIKLDFNEGKSLQDELRTSSSLFRITRRRNNDGGDFCRDLLFDIEDIKRWWEVCVGDGERVIYLRDLFGLRRFFNNDGSYINRIV
jgi:hypothetical protein